MRADLHMHSVCSDGALAPAELVFRVSQTPVRLFSLSDHDGMTGISEAAAAAERYGLRFVSGWEISSYEGDTKVHVLGYGCRADSCYRDFLAERMRGAMLRAKEMIEKANALLKTNVTVKDAEGERRKKNTPLHAMHVARAFGKKLNRRAGDVYRAYFDKGCPAFSAQCRPDPLRAIEVIHACGGIAVLAHPGRIALDFSERESLMRSLAERGLNGIECVYTTHTAKETEYFTAFARARNMLVTGGSDFHADDGERFIGLPPFHADGALLNALKVFP